MLDNTNNIRRGLMFGTGLLALLIASQPALGQIVFNEENGHYYERVDAPAISWDDASAEAASSVLLGVQGHLATLATQQENQFFEQQGSSWGFDWIGGVQPTGSMEPGGGWSWITGEPMSYFQWADSSEPNDYSNGDEDVLEWRSDYHEPHGGWNDRNSGSNTHTRGYIVEYDVSITFCDGCLGDLNRDGRLDGRDIQGFVDCLASDGSGDSSCGCAELDHNGALDMMDLTLFVAALTRGDDCP